MMPPGQVFPKSPLKTPLHEKRLKSAAFLGLLCSVLMIRQPIQTNKTC